MRIVRKSLRVLLRMIAVMAALVILYLACAFLFARITISGKGPHGHDVTIYLLTNGVHTDIVVPARNEYMDWTTVVSYADTRGNDTSQPFLGMGWGDKGFYLQTPTWAELKPSVAFKAATGLSTTAIHATYHKTMQPGDSCRAIRVSAVQYQKLIDYIKSSFQYDGSGRVINIPTDAVYGSTDAFYEAVGSYSMFRTCNSWVNRGLKASGLKSCFWTPFDTGLFRLYRN